MAITVSPTFTETDTGEVLTDFSVDHHQELHRGLAPDYISVDDATGEYNLEIEPTYGSDEEAWSYDPSQFVNHPILGNGSPEQAARYWLTQCEISDQELSAMLDGLENYDGIERQNLEQLIAFKSGDIDFTDLPIELQQGLIAAVEGDTPSEGDYVEFNGEPIPEGDYNSALIDQASQMGNDAVAAILKLNGAVIDGHLSGEAAWDLMVNTFGEETAQHLFDQTTEFFQYFLNQQ